MTSGILRFGGVAALFSALGIAAPISPAQAYKVWPVKSIHEGMTLLAQRCLYESGTTAPKDCRAYLAQLPRWSRRSRPRLTYDDLQVAVRWPDDPGRQVRSLGIFNFGGNMTWGCKKRMKSRPTLYEAGILCTSHYGRLQFMHAQASERDESTEETRAKILEWADITYRIAIGDIKPSTKICQDFGNTVLLGAGAFARDGASCDTDEDAWTFSKFFGWRCTIPVTMRWCTDLMEGAGKDLLAVRTARGALLHMIQDSYSQSHALRGPGPQQGEKYKRLIDCSLPAGFYNFLGQKGHGEADWVPDIAPNCRSGGSADDPVTASAMTLHFIQSQADPRRFNCYLRRNVFGEGVARPGRNHPADCASSPAA